MNETLRAFKLDSTQHFSVITVNERVRIRGTSEPVFKLNCELFSRGRTRPIKMISKYPEIFGDIFGVSST